MKKRTSDKSRYKQKRGEGRLGKYIPWILVHEISSRGLSSRILGKKTKRIHHLLSTLEKRVFLLLDKDDSVLDIREQYPLPLNETIQIAFEKNIRHGSDDGEPMTMTTDFLVDLSNRLVAINVKPSQKYSRRTIEKFEIEKTYWEGRGIEWIPLTEKEIDQMEKGFRIF